MFSFPEVNFKFVLAKTNHHPLCLISNNSIKTVCAHKIATYHMERSSGLKAILLAKKYMPLCCIIT